MRSMLMTMLMAAFMTQALGEPMPWTPMSWIEANVGAVDRLEQTLALPVGADALDSYARAWWMEGHLLHGLFVQPSMLPGLEAGRVLLPGPPPYDVLDGGCGVIHVIYNPTPMVVESLACNGES